LKMQQQWQTDVRKDVSRDDGENAAATHAFGENCFRRGWARQRLEKEARGHSIAVGINAPWFQPQVAPNHPQVCMVLKTTTMGS
jgi:hypothetical protein